MPSEWRRLFSGRGAPLVRLAAASAVVAALAVPALAQQPQPLPPTDVTAPRPAAPTPAPEPPLPPTPPVEPPPTPTPAPQQPGRSAPVANTPGAPYSASAGDFTQADLEDRPILRTTDFLEEIPGLIVTQHSSQGKANQYFLRGFSLDHGTDFAGYVDDVPYNLPTNAHGQGYLDLNSVIPELIDYVDFRKGPYYPEVGDFSSTGSASIHLMDRMPYGIAKIETGMYDWERFVFANSYKVGPGDLLYAIEGNYYNGAFQLKENFNRFVGVLKYTLGDRNDDDWLSLSLIGYDASGNSVNQIPQPPSRRVFWTSTASRTRRTSSPPRATPSTPSTSTGATTARSPGPTPTPTTTHSTFSPTSPSSCKIPSTATSSNRSTAAG